MNILKKLLFGDTFYTRVSPIIRDYDLDVIKLNEFMCIALISGADAQVKIGALYHSRGEVQLGAYSAIVFPPRSLPEEVWGMLQEMNRSMKDCRYDRLFTKQSSRFSVETYIPLREFTPPRFGRAIEEMGPRVTALDEYLKEQGYVRR